MNTTDRRVKRTKKLLADALAALMKQKPLKSITVRELTELADLNRGTFYLHFKGGKGIAATAGIIFSIDWRLTVLCLAVFVLIVAVTRYVSLGSLVVSVILLAWNIYMGRCGAYSLSAISSIEYSAVTAVIAAMAFWRHRANIVRLIHGNENKIGAKKS